ncbi:putative acetyltransferase A, auxiliary subunit [Rosa chinensis]|uniref:Putative acetyltransferase A, auxiliary subunit n=1 Tax=Rosa chinensis TaxID=74649 RepID=A0A2P6S8N8_ROSCH|nr:putative acetyltransferase A, auxiliary subunit [Rosa chinensis]
MKMKDLLFEGSLSCTYGIRSLSWWLTRVTLLHQRILDESYWGKDLRNGEGLTLVSVIHLEAGMMEHIYARVDSCSAGVKHSVTGVLGFHTIHQVEPKAQMVLLSNTTSSKSGALCSSESPGPHRYDSIGRNDISKHPSESHEASDILLTSRLVENESDSGVISDGIQVGGTAADPLSAIHQAVILAKCLLIEKSTRHDDMQRWEMAPHIEVIDSQLSSYFIDRDIEKALDGLTRAVQLDPENGEAWNNIACLHMIKGKSKEAFMAFREALKFKRNSYQLWENYSHVALDVGNALEATRKVLDLTNNKRIDAELLERIMTEVESVASPTNSAMTDDGDNFPVSGTTNAESDVGKSREAEHLVEFLGKVLQQVHFTSTCASLTQICVYFSTKNDANYLVSSS